MPSANEIFVARATRYMPFESSLLRKSLPCEDRLREVAGIGPVRARRIVDAWAEHKVVRELMMFLHPNGNDRPGEPPCSTVSIGLTESTAK
jgi:hypothetical protein